MSLLLLISQTLIFLSTLPEATQVPSGWNLTQLTSSKWSMKVLITDFCATSHNFTEWSLLPETISLESGENRADLTQLVCETREAWNFLSLTLIIFIILSLEPVSKSLPSWEKSTVRTGAVWAFTVWEVPLLFELFQ